MSETKKKAKRIKKLEVMVADVIHETADTVTLLMFSGNERLDYKPGHFSTIDPKQFAGLERWSAYLEDQKGRKEKPRAYSLASAPHEKYLAVTIKEERYASGVTKYPPLLSPVLVRRTPVGTRMQITGFTGPYYLPDDIEDRTEELVHVCAGSGFVPNWSIIKHALHNNMKLRHTVIYGNRSWNDVIYWRELEALQRENPEKLRVIHALSREDEANLQEKDVHKGRVTAELLAQYIPRPSEVVVSSCGPALGKWEKLAAKERGETLRPQFMETVIAALGEIGITKDRLHTESW